MAKIVIKNISLGKNIHVLNLTNEEIIRELSETLKVPPEEVVNMAFRDVKISPKLEDIEKIKELQEEFLNVREDMFRVYGEWNRLQIKKFFIIQELRDLAVSLAGVLNQNRTLRRILNVGKHEKYDEIMALGEKYLFTNSKT